jgi:hypothetical protein
MAVTPRAALLCAACAGLVATLTATSAAEAAPAPAAVAVSAARPSPATRMFTVRLNARASQVAVCDLEPFWCAPAAPAGRRSWTAVLPTGPLPSSGPSDATDLDVQPPAERIAGASPTFHVAVISISKSGAVRRRTFRGVYGDAAASRPSRPAG